MIHSCYQCSRNFQTAAGLNIHNGRVHKTIPILESTQNASGSLEAVDNTTRNEGILTQIAQDETQEEPGLPTHIVQDGTGESFPTTLPVAPGDVDTSVPLQSEGPMFAWGEATSGVFIQNMNTIYEKVVFWKKNLFKLPSGAAGKSFIKECTRLIKAWTSKSALRAIALKCIMIMPHLLLQKPAKDSKAKDHSEAIKRRMALWHRGDLSAIFQECDTIQKRMKKSMPSNSTEAISKKFASLMKKGNASAAVKLLTSNMEGGILPLTEETMQLLQSKHPEAQECQPEAIFEMQAPEVHPVVFEEIDGESVRKAAMLTRGGSGPSGLDADGWRHILVSRNFGTCSAELRTELATLIRQLCTEKVEINFVGGNSTSSLEALLACRLLPLDKCPGLRPIGVGEVLRRIAGKVVMSVVKSDVQHATGSLQVCAGQPGGCEAAIHAMRSIYEDEDTDALLLIDAANAFNSLNREAMLMNIKNICPIAYTYAYNCYAVQARLFVTGGMELRSKEGTTQGDPPSMAFYAIGLMPLILQHAKCMTAEKAKQVGFADDLTGGGKLLWLRQWFDAIVQNGPMYGYDAEPTKSWLIVKEEQLVMAEHIFAGTGVRITTRGKKHLGAVVGQLQYKNEFVSELVEKWVQQIKVLAEIAAFEPQAAYAAFTTCIRHKYTFYMRTIPNISELLQPLESAIRLHLISALLEGRMCSDDERCLLSLPIRLGGMGMIDVVKISDSEHENSKQATKVLTDAITAQQTELPHSLDDSSKETKAKIRSMRRKRQTDQLEVLRSRMTPVQLRANDIAKEVGSSNWLSALPLADKGYVLSKREFWDSLCLRYSWTLPRLPSTCACGSRFNVSHAFSCKKGGFVSQRHNELRDLTGELLEEVCNDVCIEPVLGELTGETLALRTANSSDEARLDISARGVWTKGQRAFFDVRVFDPLAQSYNGQTLDQAYHLNEEEKKRAYNERILQVENGTFTPLVFCAAGGMGPECSAFYKQLASLLADKRGQSHATVSSWLRTKLSFALLRSALLCVRGTRNRFYKPAIAESDIDIDVIESEIRPF